MIYPDIAQIQEDDKFQSSCHETKSDGKDITYDYFKNIWLPSNYM